MKIFESLNGADPNGMVEFRTDADVFLYSHPKNTLIARAVNNQYIQIIDASNQALTTQLLPGDILKSDGTPYGATLDDVVRELNNFFFQLADPLPSNLVTFEQRTLTTTDGTPQVIYQVLMEEKQAINVFVRGIAKIVGDSSAFVFTALGAGVRDVAGAVLVGGANVRTQALENVTRSPRIRQRVTGNFYEITVDSRTASQTFDWSLIIEKTDIITA